MTKTNIQAVKLKINAILGELSTANPHSVAMQLLSNEAQVDELLEKGDLIEIPRCVQHHARFMTIEDAESFIEDIGKFGFSVSGKHIHEDEAEEDEADEDGESTFCVMVVRNDSVDIESIDSLSLKVCELVENYDGVYYGWKSVGHGVIKQQDFE